MERDIGTLDVIDAWYTDFSGGEGRSFYRKLGNKGRSGEQNQVTLGLADFNDFQDSRAGHANSITSQFKAIDENSVSSCDRDIYCLEIRSSRR